MYHPKTRLFGYFYKFAVRAIKNEHLNYPDKIEGLLINLRSITINDADYLLSIRLNPKFTKYLNKVENDINKQKKWLQAQIEKPGDYYFIIETKEQIPKGAIALYDQHKNRAEFGRWICTGNSLESLESAILIFEFGFNYLHLDEVYNITASANNEAGRFHDNFGCTRRETKTVQMPGHPLGDKFEAIERFIKKEEFEPIKQKHYELIKQFVR